MRIRAAKAEQLRFLSLVVLLIGGALKLTGYELLCFPIKDALLSRLVCIFVA